MMTKVCTKCKVDRPVSEFYPRKNRGPNALTSWCKVCLFALRRGHHSKKPRQRGDYMRLWHYGITPEVYEAMLLRADGRCECCGGPFAGGVPQIEHNHQTGRVRGLVCHKCNRAIAVIEDPSLFASASRWVASDGHDDPEG
jgi:hypothetical protein